MAYSKEIDKKWQKKWKEEGLYKYNPDNKGEKFYTMEMFSYPSGANLHLGHWFNFAPADSYARFKTMQGYNVFHPMGFDAFGLPAENYAIKTGIHPQDSTVKNIETMKKQLEEMGATYDWDYSVETCMPEYYKWTQWIFTKLYEKGLAYKKEAPVNWCGSCNTVLANEQVVDCKCERCGTTVERKKLAQWFFKTTEYADELIEGLKEIDWPETTKKIQTNWIGRSEGAEVKFKIDGLDEELSVFTTRVDTLNGVTYVVAAPESELALKLTTGEHLEEVMKYREETAKASEIDRMSTEREKTGVFTGSYAINPINGEKVPIWLSDYVIEGYGTGVVMAVPAHDDRDYEFAKKYELGIKQVIEPEEGENKEELPYTEDGILVNSGNFTGMTSKEARKAIVEALGKTDEAKTTVNYRLKDWLVSRQRYWGAPIPIINCPDCGIVPVPEEQLPVLLPYDVEFKPDGESPLKKSKEFMNCECPNCKKPATREADTLDTFVCSSWYYLRYPDAKNDKEAWDKKLINRMLPVDAYIGGREHAAMHLIYARFMTKALRDMGYLDFDEPFKKLVHQGMILGSDGNKMSKSKGNTVSPDKYIDEFGSDAFRMYLMFGFSFTEGGPWKDEGIKAINKYLSRIETLSEKISSKKDSEKNTIGEAEETLVQIKNRTIKMMEKDINNFQFNTAIARSMEFLNEIVKYEKEPENNNYELLNESMETFVKLIAPLAPHFTEEIWERLGHKESIHKEKWPEYDKDKVESKRIVIPIQINGKIRTRLSINANATQAEIQEMVRNNPAIMQILEEYNLEKEFYVPGRIYSLVVGQKDSAPKKNVTINDSNEIR